MSATDFTFGDGGEGRQTFEITNTGVGTLGWSITEDLQWLLVSANEECQQFYYGVVCGGGTPTGSGSSHGGTISGSGAATVAVRAPGYGLPSGETFTRTFSVTAADTTVTITVTIVTSPNFEYDCANFQDDDGDGSGDSTDRDCLANPFAGF